MAPQSHAFLFLLAESGEYSDFTLVCNDHQFKLHQVIVCPQSSVITAALSGGFQEATSKTLTVNEFDISTVQYMISFLYTGEYQICSKRELKSSSDDGHNQENTDHLSQFSSALSDLAEDETVEDLLSHLRVNAIADYYNIENLAQYANSKIRVILEQGQNAKVFPRVIQEVSTSNRDPDVRSIIASAAVPCIEELCELKAFQDMELEHNLSTEILRACSERIRTLQHRLDVAQHNVIIYQELRDDERQGKESVIEQIDKSMDLLKQTYGCRHCANGFGCYFEKKGLEGHPSYVLRCKECRCRHK